MICFPNRNHNASARRIDPRYPNLPISIFKFSMFVCFFRFVIDVYNKNAMAAVRFTVFFLPYMRKQKWGRVVTIASRFGHEGGGRPWFNMANSAEISLMKTLSMKSYLAKDGITFNSVAPGCIMIPDTGWEEEKENNSKAFKEMLEEEFPLGRMGTPEEVADVINFIC